MLILKLTFLLKRMKVNRRQIKVNDDTEKIKETITGEPGEKVKVCLEESDDNKKYCQTKKLPQDEDDIVKFKLEYET